MERTPAQLMRQCSPDNDLCCLCRTITSHLGRCLARKANKIGTFGGRHSHCIYHPIKISRHLEKNTDLFCCAWPPLRSISTRLDGDTSSLSHTVRDMKKTTRKGQSLTSCSTRFVKSERSKFITNKSMGFMTVCLTIFVKLPAGVPTPTESFSCGLGSCPFFWSCPQDSDERTSSSCESVSLSCHHARNHLLSSSLINGW